MFLLNVCMLLWDNSQLKSPRELLADLKTGKVSSGPVTNSVKSGHFKQAGVTLMQASQAHFRKCQRSLMKLHAVGTPEEWALPRAPNQLRALQG